eukprot:scaffold126491_cov54-Phaeocystis_antarctica.AAC.4
MAAGMPMAKMPALLSFLEVRRAGKSEAVWEVASSSTRGSGLASLGGAELARRCQAYPGEARSLATDTGATLVMLSGGLLQHQITPQAASGSGDPLPTSRSGGAGPAISGVFSTCCRASSWPGTPPSASHPPRHASPARS